MIAIGFIAVGLAGYPVWDASGDFIRSGAAESFGDSDRAGSLHVLGLVRDLAALLLCIAAGFIWGRQ